METRETIIRRSEHKGYIVKWKDGSESHFETIKGALLNIEDDFDKYESEDLAELPIEPQECKPVGLICPNCQKKLYLAEKSDMRFDRAYDKYLCEDCVHITVLDWRND